LKATINEYIELAKYYSSTKSGLFINGLLDKIVLELKEEGRLNKIGRGLIN
jgi:N utilization substance protein B